MVPRRYLVAAAGFIFVLVHSVQPCILLHQPAAGASASADRAVRSGAAALAPCPPSVPGLSQPLYCRCSKHACTRCCLCVPVTLLWCAPHPVRLAPRLLPSLPVLQLLAAAAAALQAASAQFHFTACMHHPRRAVVHAWSRCAWRLGLPPLQRQASEARMHQVLSVGNPCRPVQMLS